MPIGERMAKVESWIEGHELRCAERQTHMVDKIDDMKKLMGWLTTAAGGVAIGLLSWALTQVYNDLKKPPPPAAPAAIVAPAAPR